MRNSVVILGFLCLIVVICSVNSKRFANKQEVQNIYDQIEQLQRKYRQDSQSKFGKADERIQRRDIGEQKLRLQVHGQTDNDYVNFETAQIEGATIPTLAGTAGVSDADYEEDAETGRKFKPAARKPSGRRVKDSESSSMGQRELESAFRDVEEVTKRKCVFDRANAEPCDPDSRFSTPSGHCNNLKNKVWGMAGTAFSRKLAPTYQDGIQAPRTKAHVSNTVLPNAREVSTILTNTRVVLDNTGMSNYLMQWGQFITHECTSIAETERGITCCPKALARELFSTENPTSAQINQAREKIKELRGNTCIQIERSNDPIHGDMCISQVRAATVPSEDCSPSPRLQMNTASASIDASAVYGSSTKSMESLRDTGGKLKVQIVNGKQLPPKQDGSCSSKCPFDAGDRRINTSPNLATVHIMFLRKHNQLVDALKEINSHWDDERLFQECRKIITAIQQQIHFDEWLQHYIGRSVCLKYNLEPFEGSGFRDTYNPDLHLSLMQEIAGAAQRGHTTVGGLFQCQAQHLLIQNFNKPDVLYDEGIDGCMAGLATFPPWRSDKFFVDAMRDDLFGHGADIVALNVKRGRDVAFDSYVAYREAYGFPKINDWADLESTHPADVIEALKSVYTDVRDVELYAGGVTENKLPDGYIGALFAEIMGDGYKKLRNADRFHYESESARFTESQVDELRKYKFSNLACDVGNLESIPTNIFKRQGPENPLLICANADSLDLSLWKEDPSTPKCEWVLVPAGESKCCDGKKTITRKCVGGRECKPGSKGCKGEETIEENCSKNHPSCSSNKCKWVEKHATKCCNGKQTITRKCQGGRGCRPGKKGCEGAEKVSRTCTINADSCPQTCKWKEVSSTGCCYGKDTIKRTCVGGKSCKPGSRGCSGLTTIKKDCKCPRNNLRCGHNCPAKDECEWKTVSQGACCNKKRLIRRKCVGLPHCRPGSTGCSGRTAIRETCKPSCPSYNPKCSSELKCSSSGGSCRWKTIRTSKCCRGFQVERRRCVGGRRCRTGAAGCPGKRTVRKRCNKNECRRPRRNRNRRPASSCRGRRCFPRNSRPTNRSRPRTRRPRTRRPDYFF